MSQAGIINTTSGPSPPSVPTSFVTNNGTAVPAANILNVLGGTSTDVNDNGIQTAAPGSSNTVTIQLTNRLVGTLQTTDGSTSTLLSLPLGATPGVYAIKGYVAGFIPALNQGGAYFFEGSARTDGNVATEMGGEFSSFQEDSAIEPAFVLFSVSGNNSVIQITGAPTQIINWRGLMEYIKVT